MPALWWHHVESLTAFNVLVNYWWKGDADAAKADSARDALLHCLLAMNGLPAEQRAAWGAIFDHYAFHAGAQTAGHIPAHRRGVLGEISPEQATTLAAYLAERLTR